MGEEIVENIFAQSNQAKTEKFARQKGCNENVFFFFFFFGGGVNLPQIGQEKITVAWKSLSIRPARPDGPSRSVYINLAGFSKRLSTVLSPVFRMPPSPNFPISSSYKNRNCLNIRTSLDILDNRHPTR